MPTTPGDAPQSDTASDKAAALDHVVTNLFDAELERLAFGRPQSEAEKQKAAAAAEELARRSAAHAARSGEPPSVAPAPRVEVFHRTHTRAQRDRDARPWWSRTPAIVAASILIMIAATSIVPTLSNTAVGSSSLDVFARAASVLERGLGAQLQREGLRLSVTPRIIAEREGVSIAAYRFVSTAPGERPRNEVCLLLIDERALGLPTCADRLSFLSDGMLATLSGQSRLYVVQWGPTGAPTVSVLPPVDPAPRHPESAAAQAFFTNEQSEADLAYSDRLRELHSDDRLIVRVLSTTPIWDAVGTLVASADTGLWSYCVHLFQPASDVSTQLGANVTCAGLATFERDGLVAQARTADRTLLVEWNPDDTVLVHELGGP